MLPMNTNALVLTVETMAVDSMREIDCVEVRIMYADPGCSRRLAAGRCYFGHMPSLESAVDRALEGCLGSALLAGLPVPALLAVAEQVKADGPLWSSHESGSGRWSEVSKSYPLQVGA